MVSNPGVVHYVCIAHHHHISSETTILAEFDSDDSVLRDMAHKCLNCSPPHHSVFSHTHLDQSYTYLISDGFIFFGIFDKIMLKCDQIELLGRLKQIFNGLIKGDENNKFTSYCLQGEIHPIFHKLLSKSKTLEHPFSGLSKTRKIFSIKSRSPSKITHEQKKRLLKNETLVCGKFDFPGDGNGVCEVKNKEIVCHNSVIDGGSVIGRQKANKIWRRHVWVVLILDLAICLILFGIWFFVCRGFQCIEA